MTKSINRSKILKTIFSKEELETIQGALTRQEWEFDDRLARISNKTGMNTKLIENYKG